VIGGGEPFVLLDDARAEAAAPTLLYARPVEIVQTRDPHAVRAVLEELRRARGRGLHAAGFLSYEAGYSLEDRLEPLRAAPAEDAPPLLWFGLFERAETIPSDQVLDRLPDPRSGWSAAARPLIEQQPYQAAVETIARHIAAGDIYQANFSFPAAVRVAGHPLAIYCAARQRAAAGHGGIVFTGEHWLLSFSPELFFELSRGRISARPMKGTAARCGDEAGDRAAIAALREDPKQRAENLMIVDLLRNDLSRVSQAGTVKVPELFAVETYPTVHQMTSTVTAELEQARDPVDVLEAIFPCGSITGAPKIRAMEIIAGLEQTPRGPYTGSIGSIAPNGRANFNVAIRTLVLRQGAEEAVLGLGSGIVADSRAEEEWQECLAKAKFVHDPAQRLDLIETMRFDPEGGIVELERHLSRMKRSSDALGFAFDRHGARNELQAATFRLREPARVRLQLSASGSLAIEVGELPPEPEPPVPVALRPMPVAGEDFRLRHKTSDRAFYDQARDPASFETVFVDAEGFLTEGSFTSLFVERGGRLLTPPLARGLLPGIFRERLIEEGGAEEAELRPQDLEHGFSIGNALRGLIDARLA
jgi:para-aminobenzoate synthetase / 4-amino-4-deoxychorismate lyase